MVKIIFKNPIVALILAFSLFSGIIAVNFMDFLNIATSPLSGEVWKNLGLDVLETISNSQGVISESVKAFPDADDMYKPFLLMKILAGSLITLLIIYLIYKLIKWITPGGGEPTSAGTLMERKILILIASIVILWVVSMVYSIIVDKGLSFPLQGWVDLIRYNDPIREYLLEAQGVS